MPCLLLTWLLWGTKQAARLLKMDISHQRTLRLARWLFLAVLAVPALMLLLNDLLLRRQLQVRQNRKWRSNRNTRRAERVHFHAGQQRK